MSSSSPETPLNLTQVDELYPQLLDPWYCTRNATIAYQVALWSIFLLCIGTAVLYVSLYRRKCTREHAEDVDTVELRGMVETLRRMLSDLREVEDSTSKDTMDSLWRILERICPRRLLRALSSTPSPRSAVRFATRLPAIPEEGEKPEPEPQDGTSPRSVRSSRSSSTFHSTTSESSFSAGPGTPTPPSSDASAEDEAWRIMEYYAQVGRNRAEAIAEISSLADRLERLAARVAVSPSSAR